MSKRPLSKFALLLFGVLLTLDIGLLHLARATPGDPLFVRLVEHLEAPLVHVLSVGVLVALVVLGSGTLRVRREKGRERIVVRFEHRYGTLRRLVEYWLTWSLLVGVLGTTIHSVRSHFN